MEQEEQHHRDSDNDNTPSKLAIASLPPSQSPSSTPPTRATFTLGAPESRRTSVSSESSKPHTRAGARSSHVHPMAQYSNAPRHCSHSCSRVKKSRSSTSSIRMERCTTTSPTSPCINKRSDSACFSEEDESTTTITTSSSSISSSSSLSSASSSSLASSTAEFSRATSCAHPECVMAQPCERMIQLSGIASWPTPAQARRASSFATSGEASTTSTILQQNTHRQPQNRDLMVLDNACGSSALVTSHLIDTLPFELLEESQFIATDLSSKCVREATRRIAEGDWSDHVFTYIMDQQHMLGSRDGDFTHVFTNFGIHLAKDVDATLKEMKRVLMPGGICAFTVWKRLPWLDILADAINQEYKNRPMKFPSHEDALMSLTRWNPWHDIEWIRRKVKEVGFIEEEDGRSSLSSSPSSFVKHEADEITQKEDESENGTQKTDEDIEEKKDDWSMYEFESAQGRSVSVPSPRRTSRNDKSTSPRTASPSSGSFMPDSTSTSPACESSATLPLSPPPVPSNSRVSAHDKGSLTIESTISTHRYTKHEFISNFGTSVLDHLLAASWGKERIFTKNDSVRIELREALNRYLCRKYPEDWDEIEVEMEALVVIIKKGEKVDVPSEM